MYLRVRVDVGFARLLPLCMAFAVPPCISCFFAFDVEELDGRFNDCFIPCEPSIVRVLLVYLPFRKMLALVSVVRPSWCGVLLVIVALPLV